MKLAKMIERKAKEQGLKLNGRLIAKSIKDVLQSVTLFDGHYQFVLTESQYVKVVFYVTVSGLSAEVDCLDIYDKNLDKSYRLLFKEDLL